MNRLSLLSCAMLIVSLCLGIMGAVPPSERQRFATSLEQTLLDLGHDTTVTTEGKWSEVLVIRGYSVNRVFANDFAKLDDSRLWQLVVNLEFKKIRFINKLTKDEWGLENTAWVAPSSKPATSTKKGKP